MKTFLKMSLGVLDGTADAAMEKPAENNARLHDSCIGNHAPEFKIVTLVTATALSITVLTATWNPDLHQPNETPHRNEFLRSGNVIRIYTILVWSQADDYQLLQRFQRGDDS
jgi:hypothetical protein